MGFREHVLGVPTAQQVAQLLAAETAKPILENLDKYHLEWAGFNREIEGRVRKLEQGGLEEAVRLLELRVQTLEQDRNKLRIDVEEHLEQTARLYNRLRMRYAREEPEREEVQPLFPSRRDLLGAG